MMGRTTYPALHFRITSELDAALEEAVKKSGMPSWSKNDQARYMLECALGVWREPWMPEKLKRPTRENHRRKSVTA